MQQQKLNHLEKTNTPQKNPEPCLGQSKSHEIQPESESKRQQARKDIPCQCCHLVFVCKQASNPAQQFKSSSAPKTEKKNSRAEFFEDKALTYTWDILVNFIREHVCILLQASYIQIKKEEEYLNAQPCVSIPEQQGRRNLERLWFQLLYSDNSTSHEGTKHVHIVGPVGERPLNVCAQAIYRFGHVDFDGMGNYVATGIVKGILDFVQPKERPVSAGEISDDVVDYFQKQVTSQYSKDYCAIVGQYRVREDQKKVESWTDEHPFPYWKQISKWKNAHMKQNRCLNAPHLASMFLVGMFEGETILFPLIAGKHISAMNTLLKFEEKLLKFERQESAGKRPSILVAESDQESESDQDQPRKRPSFLQLSVRGLFFHPKHRRCHTSFSVWKGWMHYISVRCQDVNLQASSELCYLGLNALSFAVRFVCNLNKSFVFLLVAIYQMG